jgi:uncharacterized protein
MDETVHIPMFPLAILPLPGELVPLHIFEPRYRQLLQDAETNDITFGIYFSHEINQVRLGSLMRLESIIKRYPGGESDIIVKCEDVFVMDKLALTYKTKMYPGGDVRFHQVDVNKVPSVTLYELFLEYLKSRNINQYSTPFSIYQIACELNLDLVDRYKFLRSTDDRHDQFLLNRIRYQLHLLSSEARSKDVYHLN